VLKRRILGPNGHLSNDDSAELLASQGLRAKWAVLSHLSANNNTPRLAIQAHRRAGRVPVTVASREGRGPAIRVE
jgi:phosphoribosyl 1,2-cyclic phosphodiesterase